MKLPASIRIGPYPCKVIRSSPESEDFGTFDTTTYEIEIAESGFSSEAQEAATVIHEIIHAITHTKPVHSSNEKVREIVSQDAMPDVVTFNQKATVNGEVSTVEFRLGNPNEAFKPGGITKRNAWHICAWRRILAIQSWFPANDYGEDWVFAARLCAVDNLKEVHIERVLHYYYHSAATTEAPPPQ